MHRQRGQAYRLNQNQDNPVKLHGTYQQESGLIHDTGVNLRENHGVKLILGLQWMIAAARSRKGIPMAKRLATELMDAFNNTGGAVRKKEDTHKMAEANRAFAHFSRF